ncbi:MAG TPA: hypothetical protein PKE47_04120, partial [Verrucomicrobiota bacterium]|nr:hypothetical protein [Verrucomicrobiota bacterium]
DSVIVPLQTLVPAGGTAVFSVTLEVFPGRLPAWPLNIGSQGGNGPLLQSVEFDGHLTLTETTDGERLRLPWQILPRRSADNAASPLTADALSGSAEVMLDNAGGAQAGVSDVFHWIGDSPLDHGAGAGLGANFALIDLQHVGVRTVTSGDTPFLQVAISTWDVRSHGVYPAVFEVWLDKDADGIYDAGIFTAEIGAFASTGQTAAWGGPLGYDPLDDEYDWSQVLGPRTFVDGDLNSSVIVISMPLSVLGLDAASKVAVAVVAADNYFTGFITDMIPWDGFYPPLLGQVFTLDQPHFTTGSQQATVPAGGSAAVTTVVNPAGAAASPSQLGLMFFHRQAVLGREV